MISTTILPKSIPHTTWKHSTMLRFSRSEKKEEERKKKRWHFRSKCVTRCESRCHLPHLSPSYNRAHKRSLLGKEKKSVQAAPHDIHLFIPGIINHRKNQQSFFFKQLRYQIMNKTCKYISSGPFTSGFNSKPQKTENCLEVIVLDLALCILIALYFYISFCLLCSL